MFNLNRLFEDFFADPEFSVSEKLSFASDMQDRVAANNSGGAFDIVLAELNTSFLAAGGTTGTEEVALAVRKAAVHGKQTLLHTIKATISRRAGKVINDFEKGSAQYLEFFPQGLTPYSEMNEADVPAKLDVLIAAGHNHDPALETEFTALKASWLSVKQAAGDKVAAVSAADVKQDAAIKNLHLSMLRVIFTAALTFAGQPEMGPALFDQSRLENKQGKAATPATP